MRPVPVVVDAPVFDEDFGLDERVEHFAGQQFVADAVVERLDVAVLPW